MIAITIIGQILIVEFGGAGAYQMIASACTYSLRSIPYRPPELEAVAPQHCLWLHELDYWCYSSPHPHERPYCSRAFCPPPCTLAVDLLVLFLQTPYNVELSREKLAKRLRKSVSKPKGAAKPAAAAPAASDADKKKNDLEV